MADVNLRAMLTIRDELGVKVGYSDHTVGIEVPVAATVLGACVIEKHFTLARTLPGPDHAASLEPDELRAMVSAIRNIEEAMGDGLTWHAPPLEAETEITGPLALKLFISSTTSDADFFITVQAWSPDGTEVVFQGTLDPNTPIAQGWLRASHRKLDSEKTLYYRPYHTHDNKQPLIPHRIYEIDIEIWPTCIILPAGYTLSINIRGKDFERPGPDASPAFPTRGSGPFYHNDAHDRPAETFAGTTTVHTGPDHDGHLLLPVIPAERG